ncbi:small integral membrane protein DUF2273 [Caldicellulosiruptor bescii]|uniref:DUF2273 domain-containing protein n=3 Tax=Caldicellulosiruptor TaxID=44000 RepID=B9MKW6_CALBD|nr:MULTISPECIES: DUF2273 domain-containing protein [Caldicellulosiruptor]ACM60974.1 conserved hypothetical protein [Caldicellulosiruptor bescii DSM 6725]ADQ45709.1 hypothetical protein Calkro_0829 [Caldicellulosiruptor kronotskyensis 2002]PBC89211.1 small integral membrane protein DUF2273 [Caldicellulosiruptor bescii]PBC91307.1 small integral membrane protein DUF2273 [Caldicellulosiruptor bescii]PBD03281.1 small integral membrane protein DUF2273 [Caldicellulosiruptor bescii]
MNKLEKFIKENVGMLVGGALALILILFILEVGIVKAILITVVVIVGIILGKKFITYDKIRDLLKDKN